VAKGPSGCSHYTAIAALGHTTSKRLSGHFGVEPGDLLAASRMAGNGAIRSLLNAIKFDRFAPKAVIRPKTAGGSSRTHSRPSYHRSVAS
jgi:hypothetical protein